MVSSYSGGWRETVHPQGPPRSKRQNPKMGVTRILEFSAESLQNLGWVDRLLGWRDHCSSSTPLLSAFCLCFHLPQHLSGPLCPAPGLGQPSLLPKERLLREVVTEPVLAWLAWLAWERPAREPHWPQLRAALRKGQQPAGRQLLWVPGPVTVTVL